MDERKQARPMVKDSILLTVYDREYEVLLATLRSLSRCDMTDTEVIVVDDGSTMDYAGVIAYGQKRFENFRWHRMEEYEAFRIGETGFNNPARAFNTALSMATGERIVVMSSDVLVNPSVVRRMRRIDPGEMAWTPLVIDTESGMQYCGPARLFPMPWFFVCARSVALAVGGWDEKYLDGINYEDNDFVGRVVLKTGRFVGDWNCVVYHQSHNQPAYALDDPVLEEARKRNCFWTKKKWSGIPFDADYIPFNVLRKPHESGNVVHECTYEGTLLEDTIRNTIGLVAGKEKVHAL